MNVVIYARFSSHSQTEQSIEGQLKVCNEYAAANNYVVVGEYIDRAQSGTTDNRTEFQRMIADSDRHTFEGVLVYQLDRFARNRYDSAINKEYLLTTKLFCGHCKEMMTGCTGTGKHGNKYHYYICNGAKKKVCDKKTIQKALIEERVVQACSELLTEEKVKYIADQVYAACKNDGDLLSVKRLKAALKEADSAIENLWVALEKGQSVDMITERIHKREAEKKELEKQLAIEIKKQSGMEYSVILSFLDYLRMLPNDNEYKRRALVNIFINAIYLYDGYFTMILNAGNRPLSIENIPLDDIEKTFENDDVGCSSNSQLVADAPPK